MTRAMENLKVFMLEDPREKPLRDLAGIMKDMVGNSATKESG
jgi:hypothetical protein